MKPGDLVAPDRPDPNGFILLYDSPDTVDMPGSCTRFNSGTIGLVLEVARNPLEGRSRMIRVMIGSGVTGWTYSWRVHRV